MPLNRVQNKGLWPSMFGSPPIFRKTSRTVVWLGDRAAKIPAALDIVGFSERKMLRPSIHGASTAALTALTDTGDFSFTHDLISSSDFSLVAETTASDHAVLPSVVEMQDGLMESKKSIPAIHLAWTTALIAIGET